MSIKTDKALINGPEFTAFEAEAALEAIIEHPWGPDEPDTWVWYPKAIFADELPVFSAPVPTPTPKEVAVVVVETVAAPPKQVRKGVRKEPPTLRVTDQIEATLIRECKDLGRAEEHSPHPRLIRRAPTSGVDK